MVTVKITKADWVMPFQKCMRFSVQPHDYAMNLQAMTKEKLQFLLPVVFTVGPDVNQRGANTKQSPESGPLVTGAGSDGAPASDDHANSHRREDQGDSLMKYAMLLADSASSKAGSNHQFLENIVKGIIEGEVRVLVSSMTMEEIFTEREVFKRRIFRNIQSELDQFGLKIYNANASSRFPFCFPLSSLFPSAAGSLGGAVAPEHPSSFLPYSWQTTPEPRAPEPHADPFTGQRTQGRAELDLL